MNSPWAVVVLALLLIRNYSTYAQQYIFDENFSPAVEGQLDNIGGVLAVSIQEDNKILIGGSFTSVQGEPRNGMARLNADGSIDPDFNPGGGFDGAVRVIVLQPAGKILVGGDFKNVDGSPFTCIVRLLGNGQVDTTFSPPVVSTSVATPLRVEALTVQEDGKIVISGIFTHLDGISHVCIGRLMEDGTLDSSFVMKPNNIVLSQASFPNGDLLLAGGFKVIDGVEKFRVAKVSSEGILDPNYNPGTGPDNIVLSVALDSESRALVSGGFLTFDGVSTPGIARILADGTLDSSFLPQVSPAVGVDFALVSELLVQENGKIFIGGLFGGIDGITRNSLARLNDDGTVDETFDPGVGSDDGVNTLTFDHDGNLLVGGYFELFNGEQRLRLARYLRKTAAAVTMVLPNFGDGSFGFSFETETGFVYEVQQCLDLSLNNWETVQIFGGDGNVTTATGLRGDLDKAFFRVQIK